MILKDVIQPVEFTRNDFLHRLPEIDRQNTTAVATAFINSLRNMGESGVLLGVGGYLTKPPPRKDIDTLVVFDRVKPAEKLTPYRYALADFENLRAITLQIVNSVSGLSIARITEPLIDEEFGSESILRHEGSIEVHPQNGVPIEFIRSPERGIEKVLAMRRSKREPFVIIARS